MLYIILICAFNIKRLMTWKTLLFVVFLLGLAQSRLYKTSLKFSELKQHNGWYYLQKFTFAPGVAKFDVEVYVRGKGKSKSHDIYLQGIPSSKWQEELQKKCKSFPRMPLMIMTLRMTGQKDTDVFQFSVKQEETYYWAVKDCYTMFRKDYDNDNLTLYISFKAYSNDVELQNLEDDASRNEKVNQQQLDDGYIQMEQEEEQEVKATPAEQVSEKNETSQASIEQPQNDKIIGSDEGQTLQQTSDEGQTSQQTSIEVVENKGQEITLSQPIEQNPQQL